MKELCLVTYTRSSEGFTGELDEISSKLYEIYGSNFKVVICCESCFETPLKKYEIEFVEIYGTKYRRLINLMEIDDSKYYLSIDNDITGKIPELQHFVKQMLENDYEVGWGHIRANRQQGLISNMVSVDKLLSHNIIRPLLWKMGVGISIPGQVFCIKGDSYRGKLIEIDTFLDDLALGLYVNVHQSKKYIITNILGYEEPNSKFMGLWKQRSRWAIGYASILKSVAKQKEYRNKVLIHGLSYHMSWILNWIIIAALAILFWPAALLYMLIISAIIAKNDIAMIVYSFLYQVIFPVFHIRWGFVLVKELMKGGKK